MKLKVTYEWDYETMDENDDIIDHNHADKLEVFNDVDITPTLVLVRDVGNAEQGLVDRSWAYVKFRHLPEYFTDASNCKVAKVPQKFINELKEYYDRLNQTYFS